MFGQRSVFATFKALNSTLNLVLHVPNVAQFVPLPYTYLHGQSIYQMMHLIRVHVL